MKFKLVTLTLLVALLASPVFAGFKEIAVSSYDFTPEPGAGWPEDPDRIKLTDNIVPAEGELWDANKSVGWNLPANTGPSITFDLGESTVVEVISLTTFGSYYGFLSVDIYSADDPNFFELVGSFDNALLDTSAKTDSITQDIILNAPGQHIKMDFVSAEPTYDSAWTMISEVDFFGLDPNTILIQQQPQDVSAIAGTDIELSVGAWGKTLPLAYQWKMNGADIDGATSDTLQIIGVTVDDAGVYSCVVTSPENVRGVESAEAIVDVLVAAPLTDYGKRVINHKPAVYWSFDEEDGAAIEMSSLLSNRVITADNPIRFENGDLGNAVSFTEFANVFGTLTLDSVETNGAFAIEFWVRTDTPDMTNRYITEIGTPTIGNMPGVIFGYQTMELELFGSGARSNGFAYTDPNDWAEWQHVVLAEYNDEIEAYKNGVLVEGFGYEAQNDMVLNLTEEIAIGSVRKTHFASPDSVFLGDLDEFAVYSFDGMSKEAAKARAQAIALHGDLDGAAYVTESPLDMIAPPSTDAILYVSAAGAEPISYQWKRDGVDIDGATGSSLVLTEVQPGVDGGSYSCVVSNDEGSEESAAAVVTVACYYDIPGDLNNDCVVDLLDLAAISAHWLEDSSVQP